MANIRTGCPLYRKSKKWQNILVKKNWTRVVLIQMPIVAKNGKKHVEQKVANFGS